MQYEVSRKVFLSQIDHPRTDPISSLCRVLGCGANQDGKSETFLSPNEIAQAALVREVLDRANVDVNDDVYVEVRGSAFSRTATAPGIHASLEYAS